VSKTEYTVLGARQGAVLAAIKDRSPAPSFFTVRICALFSLLSMGVLCPLAHPRIYFYLFYNLSEHDKKPPRAATKEQEFICQKKKNQSFA
jgi:hypothetical protein